MAGSNPAMTVETISCDTKEMVAFRETPIVTEALGTVAGGSAAIGQPRRSPDIFKGWWLQSFGYALAALYLLYFVILYRAGTWIIGKTGLPIYTDFANAWAAG